MERRDSTSVTRSVATPSIFAASQPATTTTVGADTPQKKADYCAAPISITRLTSDVTHRFQIGQAPLQLLSRKQRTFSVHGYSTSHHPTARLRRRRCFLRRHHRRRQSPPCTHAFRQTQSLHHPPTLGATRMAVVGKETFLSTQATTQTMIRLQSVEWRAKHTSTLVRMENMQRDGMDGWMDG